MMKYIEDGIVNQLFIERNDEMKNLIIIQNDMEMLDLLLFKYPKETKKDVLFHFVNDTRFVDQRKDIDDRIKNSDCDIKYNYQVHDSKDINKDAIQKVELNNKLSKLFFANYRFNIQFAVPIYFSSRVDKILMTDDDIVIYLDPSFLFDKYGDAIIQVPFNKYDPNNISPQFNAYKEVFNLDMTVEEYNKNTMGAGTFIYSFEDNFIDYFDRFYSNKILMQIFEKHYKKYEDGYKNNGYVAKSFFADQFWNFYFKKMIKDRNKSLFFRDGDIRLILTRLKNENWLPKKMLKTPTIIHYAAGTKKKLYIPFLKSLNVVEKNGKIILKRD